MKAFHCDRCGNLVFFENSLCIRCDKPLGFLPEALDLSAIEPEKDGLWRPLSSGAQNKRYRLCRNNTEHHVCNWMVLDGDATDLCKSCRLNEVIPDLTIPANQQRWQKLETAKRRVIYTLLRLGLGTEGNATANRPPLRFRFLADTEGNPPVLTGHAGGIITVNIAEADDDERERRRVALHEPFRTLLGHIRHEIAHYYWDVLVRDTPHLKRFRELFGDESCDYSNALNTYYQNGPSSDWQTRCVSAYASSHPWEDWAETWAHYLHITDTVETAGSFGISLRPKHPSAQVMTADLKKVAESESSFDRILQHWLPLTYALNELNRSMGLQDLYPFVLSTDATAKLRFIHELLTGPGD